ncbi:hypothetical protein [Photobacterium alginatilyticum]|uniref:MFS transporter n=1 Tax=Photobacterium alginatilyticum TaxID=1775171 RepID=A0ABW9YK92_9GAMM|nr:hypothetical protein [Photobacterium alginatilyticum]NBI54262.1 hypothetical protein [Photobacterium alginatilyticum]
MVSKKIVRVDPKAYKALLYSAFNVLILEPSVINLFTSADITITFKRFYSDMSNTQDSATTRIYTPKQVACGALGGPVGLIYFLWANFSILKKENHSKATIILGIVFIISLIFAAPFVPQEVPAITFTIVYVILAFFLSQKFHLNKDEIMDSEEYTFHSSFRVFGITIACFWSSYIVVAAPLHWLYSIGFFGA